MSLGSTRSRSMIWLTRPWALDGTVMTMRSTNGISRWPSRSLVSPSTGTPRMLGGARAARSSNTPMTLASRLSISAWISRSALRVAPTTMMLGVSLPWARQAETSSHQPACRT